MGSWEKPEFVEIKMDAEISGYQQDDDPPPDLDRPRPPVPARADGEPSDG